jgi:hypothetical protein
LYHREGPKRKAKEGIRLNVERWLCSGLPLVKIGKKKRKDNSRTEHIMGM